jgi:hypothetical protein
MPNGRKRGGSRETRTRQSLPTKSANRQLGLHTPPAPRVPPPASTAISPSPGCRCPPSLGYQSQPARRTARWGSSPRGHRRDSSRALRWQLRGHSTSHLGGGRHGTRVREPPRGYLQEMEGGGTRANMHSRHRRALVWAQGEGTVGSQGDPPIPSVY